MMYVLLSIAITTLGNDVYDRVEHGYADSDGVKIHYASLGKGPLVVMIHGFPDFWYTWRDQMDALSSDFKVVAIDTRGTTRETSPKASRVTRCRFSSAMSPPSFATSAKTRPSSSAMTGAAWWRGNSLSTCPR